MVHLIKSPRMLFVNAIWLLSIVKSGRLHDSGVFNVEIPEFFYFTEIQEFLYWTIIFTNNNAAQYCILCFFKPFFFFFLAISWIVLFIYCTKTRCNATHILVSHSCWKLFIFALITILNIKVTGKSSWKIEIDLCGCDITLILCLFCNKSYKLQLMMFGYR